MKLFCLITTIFLLFSFTFSSPLIRVRRGDGYQDVGGVYNSPAAQEYWASRFGAGFFSGLRALQLQINANSTANRIP